MATQGAFLSNVTFESFLIFLFTLLLSILLGGLIYNLLRQFLDTRMTRKGSKTVSRIAQYSIIGSGLYYGVYGVLQLDLTALLASLGILGLVVAFSSQQVIQNFIAGLLISVQRTIQLEDWIEIGGAPDVGMCKVKDIRLSRTTLRNIDGRLIYLPNFMILSSRIINYTKSGFIEFAVPLSLPISSNLEKVERIVRETAFDNLRVLPNLGRKEHSAATRMLRLPQIQSLFDDQPDLKSFEPRVLVTDISNGKLTLSVRLWVQNPSKRTEIISEFEKELLQRLKKEKVKLV